MSKPRPATYRTTNWRAYRAIEAPLVRAQWRTRLKKMFAELSMQNELLKEARGKK